MVLFHIVLLTKQHGLDPICNVLSYSILKIFLAICYPPRQMCRPESLCLRPPQKLASLTTSQGSMGRVGPALFRTIRKLPVPLRHQLQPLLLWVLLRPQPHRLKVPQRLGSSVRLKLLVANRLVALQPRYRKQYPVYDRQMPTSRTGVFRMLFPS